ncbi:MAG: hypothetical protein AB9842_09485 [Bacteroidales bacterium]
MHAYRFRILTDEQEDFVRDVEIMANQTFLDFHNYLVRLLEFDSNELASFSICNSKWYKLCEITLLDMEIDEAQDEEEEPKKNDKLKTYLMADARLNSFIEDPHQRLVYEYDFLHLRTFYLELTKIIPAELGFQYPRCVFSEGVLQKKVLTLSDLNLTEEELELGDIDLEEGDPDFDDGLDDTFLKSINDGFEIEEDQSIGINMDESFDKSSQESS